MLPVALVREVPESFVRCVTSARPRPALDPERARRQQAAYRACLEAGGFRVLVIPADEAHPDCPFIEDTAVVVGEAALVTRPGHPSRRGEVGPVADALAGLVAVTGMEAPATLDGGDVLAVGPKLFVGRTGRSNAAGRAALEDFARPLGLAVVAVAVRGVLHLKSAATALDEGTVLAAGDAVDLGVFAGLRVVAVPPEQPKAGNVVRLPDGRILVAADHPATGAAVARAGFDPVFCDVSEFARADGGLTCLSLRLRSRLAAGAP